MSKKVNPDDIAFGFEGPNYIAPGLTKREYFAALALQGIMASGKLYPSGSDIVHAGKAAVLAANILIETLNENQETTNE